MEAIYFVTSSGSNFAISLDDGDHIIDPRGRKVEIDDNVWEETEETGLWGKLSQAQKDASEIWRNQMSAFTVEAQQESERESNEESALEALELLETKPAGTHKIRTSIGSEYTIEFESGQILIRAYKQRGYRVHRIPVTSREAERVILGEVELRYYKNRGNRCWFLKEI